MDGLKESSYGGAGGTSFVLSFGAICILGRTSCGLSRVACGLDKVLFNGHETLYLEHVKHIRSIFTFTLTQQSFLEPRSYLPMFVLSKVLVQCISMLATPCSMSQKVDLAFYDQSKTTLHLHIHSLHVPLSIVLCAFIFTQA